MSTLEEQANTRKERLEQLRKLRNQRKQELSAQQQRQVPINNDLNSLVYVDTSDLDTFYYKDSNENNANTAHDDSTIEESLKEDNNSIKKQKLNTESSPTVINTKENHQKNDSIIINDSDTLETKTNELTNNLLNDYEKIIDSFKIDFKHGNANTDSLNSISNSRLSYSTTNTSITVEEEEEAADNELTNDKPIKISTHHDYSDDTEYSNIFTADEVIPEYDRILAHKVNKLHKKTDQSIMSSLRKKFKKVTV
ncbi:hypothetical protein BVG19_g3150 [[Candida] boidinii]|nr:hypothetical protein BVG19_g3150 [[Candida] boidinii]OWB52433.1 hypothetical protein B5S27_g4008 [[Candida] boidinii]